VIVGGFAVILHGYARGTMDLDLLVDPSPENIRKVKAALAVLPDNAAAEIMDCAGLRSSSPVLVPAPVFTAMKRA